MMKPSQPKSLRRRYAPKRKPYRKQANKSKYLEDSRRSGLVVHMPRNNIHCPLPLQYYTKVTASAMMFTTSGAGTGAFNQNYKCNSIYLPFQNTVAAGLSFLNINPATYEPTGVNTLTSAQMYKNWIVSGFKFELDVTPQSVLDSVVVTATPSRTGSVPTTIGFALGKPWTKQMTFASGRTYRMGDYPFQTYVPIHELIGIPKFLYDNDQSGVYWGSGGVDPAQEFPFVVYVNTGDNSIFNAPLEMRVRITYYVKFFNLQIEQMTN